MYESIYQYCILSSPDITSTLSEIQKKYIFSIRFVRT